jgi:sec-independent protein translocase protein TatC
MLSVGITFEVPLVILMLVRLGLVSARTVAGGRKIMIAGAVILAAILAPPDPFSMIMMSLPLIVICEITIWLAWFVERHRNKRPTKA